MTLGLNTGSGGSGDFLPIVKYDARSGRLFKRDRVEGPNGWQSVDTDITSPAPTFCVDFGSIEVGVASFAGAVPDFIMVPLGQPKPTAPNKDYNDTFRVKIANKSLGVRQFSSGANCVKEAMNQLHTAFEGAPEAAQGKLPMVTISETKAIATKAPGGKTTTNYAPVFTITGWADRIAGFGERTVPAPGKAAPSQHPKTNGAGAQHVPPPGHGTGGGIETPDEMPF